MIDAWGKRGILLNMYSVGEGEPVVGGELEWTDEELGAGTELGVVGVGDVVPIAVGELIDRAVADAVEALVGTYEKGSSAKGEVVAIAVEIGAGDGLATTVGNLVGGILAAAAVVVAHEEIVPVATLEDEGRFDGIVASFDGILAFDGDGDLADLAMAIDATGYGDRFAERCAEVRSQLLELDAVPERTPDEVVFAEVGVDGVPVGDAFVRDDNRTLVTPTEVGRGGVEGLVEGEADGAAVLAEGGAGVIEVPLAVAVADVGCPGVSPIAGDGVLGPLGDGFAVEDGGFLTPGLEVGGGHDANADTGGEDVVAAVFADGEDRVVYVGIGGIELGTGWALLAGTSGEDGGESEDGEEREAGHGLWVRGFGLWVGGRHRMAAY